MPAQTILFLNDKMNPAVATTSIYGASSTAAGYNTENVRDADYATAWKPNDGTADEYIQADGGSATWLGVDAETVYCAVAYDARGVDQNTIDVWVDAADNPVGTFATLRTTFTLNKTEPTVDYGSFTAGSGGRRYYRLKQLNAGRGGGTKTVKIYWFGLFRASGVYNIDTGYIADAPGQGEFVQAFNVGVMETAGGAIFTNRNASSFQSVDLTFQPATKTLWEVLRDQFHSISGPHRAFAFQYEGLRNAAKANFQIVRLHGMQWAARRNYRDVYDTTMRLRTEAWY